MILPGAHPSLHTLQGRLWNSTQSLSPALVGAAEAGTQREVICGLGSEQVSSSGLTANPKECCLPLSLPSSSLWISALFPGYMNTKSV